MYALTPFTPPAIEPVSLEEFKDHYRIDPDITEDDPLIEAMISASRLLAESHLRRKLITQVWDVTIDQFPGGSWACDSWTWSSSAGWPYTAGLFDIPLSPVQSAAITYYDVDGIATVLPTTVYEIDAASIRPRLRLAYGQVWPVVQQRQGAVAIRVTAGYGPLATDVPSPIRQWIKVAAASQYKNRELVTEKAALQVNQFLDGLLNPYRIVEI